MSENKNTAIPVNELEDLQEKEFILHELQKSAKIGWWKVNFNTHEIICSDYIMDILDLSKNTMTVEEFLEIHPDEDVDLQVPEGRVLLDHGQVQRLLGGRPVIVCKTGVQDAQYMQAEDLLNQVVYLTHQTCSLWRVSAAHDPKLQKPVRYWPKLKRGISL